MYPISPSPLFRLLYPGAIWRVPTDQKRILLTFDDGPCPGVTEWVLDELSKHQASATFFMLGKNAERHPDLVKKVKAAGHRIGNHGYEHLDGFKTGVEAYIENAHHGAMFSRRKLFRPPYGRIRPRQFLALQRHYRIVFWSVLPGDWDQSISSEKVWKRIEQHWKPGNIITLHDSEKGFEHLKLVLPRILEKADQEGYRFLRVPNKV